MKIQNLINLMNNKQKVYPILKYGSYAVLAIFTAIIIYGIFSKIDLTAIKFPLIIISVKQIFILIGLLIVGAAISYTTWDNKEDPNPGLSIIIIIFTSIILSIIFPGETFSPNESMGVLLFYLAPMILSCFITFFLQALYRQNKNKE